MTEERQQELAEKTKARIREGLKKYKGEQLVAYIRVQARVKKYRENPYLWPFLVDLCKRYKVEGVLL